MKLKKHYLTILLLFFNACIQQNVQYENTDTPERDWWHNTERSIRYLPDGEDFVITNGNKRFNRALYGTNTAYRVEAGDLPEFAQYLPGMGGNLKFGLVSGENSKWLIEADNIIARYRAGSMHYEISDSLLGEGKLHLSVWAMAEAEGLLLKMKFEEKVNLIDICWVYGGVSGKKFSRNGDIGADPESSFYLKPEYCNQNFYKVNGNTFEVYFNTNKKISEEGFQSIKESKTNAGLASIRKFAGIFPPQSSTNIADAKQQNSPTELWNSEGDEQPVLAGLLKSKELNGEAFFSLYNPQTIEYIAYKTLPKEVEQAEQARQKLSKQIEIHTPDPYLNTLGAALSVAEDGVWEDPTYLHGAIAWRMRIPGWRAAYAADRMGRHDRAKMQFRSYLKSQVTSPAVGPVVPDTAKHWARQTEKMGTSMFSSGYICRNPNGDFRPHHYDMNLVFFDQLLWHINWTGDLDFAKEIWEALERHLAWEKRNYDADGDGLYDAYCCIWASDALQYSGGGVTHSSAYNYKANKLAATIAKKIGKDPSPYQQEAELILAAMQKHLWLPKKGHFAEYKDLLGLQKVHPAAGLWTVYHSLDSEVPDPFQAYQTMRYVDTQIPHIPVEAHGIEANTYHTVSTTNWLPYTWSVNNVALAEVLHTSLAYWQAGQSQEAFILWKSALMESMYLSSCAGGFGQLPYYDAIRGELYRDFSDPIGMAARTVVEGLFGILPNALSDTLTIKPGFPSDWENASLKTPDIQFNFQRKGLIDHYQITPTFPKNMQLKLQLCARQAEIKSVKVNGKTANWQVVETAIGKPEIAIPISKQTTYRIEIEWGTEQIEHLKYASKIAQGDYLALKSTHAELIEVFDPQGILKDIDTHQNQLKAQVTGTQGHHTAFIKLKQGSITWWQPIDIIIVNKLEIVAAEQQPKNQLLFQLKNHSQETLKGKLTINYDNNTEIPIELKAGESSKEINVSEGIFAGTNAIHFQGENNYETQGTVINWEINNKAMTEEESVDLRAYFNEDITQIFENKYLSPRPTSTTLQLPWQGVGNWCYTLVQPQIDDTGLRKKVEKTGMFQLPFGTSLSTPSEPHSANIIFTSLWDNYPNSASIPLIGNASHLYVMMAGTTNPMQSRFTNGEVVVHYSDGSEERLALSNPETWYPIEQDYYQDRYAFDIGHPKPYRVLLKTGETKRNFNTYTKLKGFSDFGIEGGAATILDLPLNPSKTLKKLEIKTVANDVIIGLMSATLVRKR
ncbi:DUF4450 domain-containing protein [Flammeovirgaceae bacterium SG7u.111]|nr:DUF4450 domain-containing protein [Flammeovirgaceae bacterium SG7u.132]WPO37905.1 DUF4450 domain-containing protein [Flammeovirgaceae bacterium SG7u.111]